MQYVYLFGEVLLVLALLGFIGVIVWLVMTVLHVKNATVGHAKRLSQRPIAATKNLIATGKGLVQQEAVHARHIGASVKEAAASVKVAAAGIQESAHAVHPEDLKPAVSTLGSVTKLLKLAAQFSRVPAKQGPR
jgi:hypothetical protein